MSPRACEVAAVAHGDRQRARGDAHAFERDAVAQRVVGGRQVRLDVVRQRVHAGRGGDRRRQVERQLGVGEHRLREQLRREDDLLDVRVVVGDDRRAADLATRCRRSSAARRSTGSGSVDRAHLRVVPRVLEDVARVRAPSARSPWRRRAPRRRRGRSTAVGAVRPERGGAGRRPGCAPGCPRCRRRRRRRGPAASATNAGSSGSARDAAVGDDQRPRDCRARAGARRRACARRGRSGWWSGKLKRSMLIGSRSRSRVATSDDLEIALQFPVGDGVQPLPPLPLARRGEVVDEIVAEPVARERRTRGRCAWSRSACAARAECSRRPGWCRGSAWR